MIYSDPHPSPLPGGEGEEREFQWRVMMEVQAVEMEEMLGIFETSVGWASDTAVAGVVVRVRREYERVGTVAAQRNGSVERFKVVLRRAQLEVKLICQGWRPWLARVVAEVYPRRWLPPLLTHEM